MTSPAIFFAFIDHSGAAHVRKYQNLNYFIREAGAALGVESADSAAVLSAARKIYAWAEVFVTPWHAASMLVSGLLPDEVAGALQDALTRHETVNARPHKRRLEP